MVARDVKQAAARRANLFNRKIYRVRLTIWQAQKNLGLFGLARLACGLSGLALGLTFFFWFYQNNIIFYFISKHSQFKTHVLTQGSLIFTFLVVIGSFRLSVSIFFFFRLLHSLKFFLFSTSFFLRLLQCFYSANLFCSLCKSPSIHFFYCINLNLFIFI